MKKIAIIGTVGVPACYGGYETLAENLVKELSGRFDLTVYCSSKAYRERPKKWGGAHLKYLPLNANGLMCLPYDTLCAMDAVRYADVILLLGPNAIWLLAFLRQLGCKKRIVSNVDGLESTREKFNPVLKFYCEKLESTTANNSDLTIGDNQVIIDHLHQHYPKANCRLIEYGADHVSSRILTEETLKKYPFLAKPYAFSVCRIEKENNIHLTLQAFQNLNRNLVIVGNWNKSDYSKELFQKYNNTADIHLLQPIYDLTILDQLRSNCCIYIHGHHCGGTNPSLVEAMYLGLPVFAFDVNFNKETTEYKAAYFHDAESLEQLVSSTSDQQLQELGIAMKEISHRRYIWSRIASLYAEAFEE